MKNSYILLRNNAESTPLSAEDLQRIGLKATDLLWVECQSVCWQNPHEIPELRPLVTPAGATEENKSNTAMAVQPLQPTETTAAGKKTVLIELPEVEETVPSTTLAEMQQYGGLKTDTYVPFADEKETLLKTNHTRSLDDIKEMFIKNMEEKGKNIIEIRLPPQTKKIALYAGLVMAGALLMLLIKSFSNDKMPVVNMVPPQQVPASMTATPDELETDSAAIPESYETVHPPAAEATITAAASNQSLPAANTKPPAATPRPVKGKEKMDIAEPANESPENSTPPVSEIKIMKPVSTNDIAARLTLTANEYNVGSFGGIRNLKMTLQNDSKYLLEKVTVEIQYLNPEGIILKTDHITFQSVPPGDKATIAVDKTKRGVKIEYKIVRIDA